MPNAHTLTRDEIRQMARAMRLHGGSFTRHMGLGLELADPNRAARLIAAFPEFVRDYGPGSEAHRATTGVPA